MKKIDFDRYVVLKGKDLSEYLTETELEILSVLVGKVMMCRRNIGKDPDPMYVVVGSDWGPIYEETVEKLEKLINESPIHS